LVGISGVVPRSRKSRLNRIDIVSTWRPVTTAHCRRALACGALLRAKQRLPSEV
jgi:hypothetical protein